MTTPPPFDRSDPQWLNLVLQLHTAEYQALTNRGTNLIALESGIWVLMVLFLAMLPSLWDKLPHDIVTWGGFGVLLMMLFVLANTMYEHYNSICYIEQELRPLIGDLIGQAGFWYYERYVGERRPKQQPLWIEAAPCFGASLVLAGIIYVRLQQPDCQPREYYELAGVLALSCAYVWATIRVVKVRRHLIRP